MILPPLVDGHTLTGQIMTDKISLYRGFSKRLEDGVQINRFRLFPRSPVNTNRIVHDTADQWFYEEFGIRARSQTILCSTNIDQARDYCSNNGSLALIEPIGEYSIVYSTQVSDFLKYVIDGVYANENEIIIWLSSQNYKSATSINSLPAYHRGEVMLFCEKYNIKNLNI
jgi:hypothetical protein